jgi:hypothetical protein
VESDPFRKRGTLHAQVVDFTGNRFFRAQRLQYHDRKSRRNTIAAVSFISTVTVRVPFTAAGG